MMPLPARRLGFTLLLFAYVFYAVKLAPPDDGHEPSLLDLAVGRGPAHNPAVWAVFNLLGVIPLLYWALLFPDGRGQRIWVWPFALGMMALGSFALLPYLVLRRPYPLAASGTPNVIVRWFGGRPFAAFAGAALILLLLYGLARGDWADYARWFRASNFVHVMTLDLLLLTLLFPALLRDDMRRRGVAPGSALGRIALALPLLGPAWYLLRRPAESDDPNDKKGAKTFS